MKITIHYEASWRNSFLDGSNNEPPPKGGRNFVASMKKLREKKENYQYREVTMDTILGVLNRLIGDQRKLYQSKQSFGAHKHYFEDIIDSIRFEDKPIVQSQEVVYIRNMSGSSDRNAFTGMIRASDPAFTSDFSQLFWGVLALDFTQLCQFILDDKKFETSIELTPLGILSRLEEIQKMKSVENAGDAQLASEKLAFYFDKYKPLDKEDMLKILPIYCSALYLNLKRLEEVYTLTSVKGKGGGVQGISHNGFTRKDFMARFTTGSKKLIYGNPYIQEEFLKGEGKIRSFLMKASGRVDIYLDIVLERAVELKNLIDSAGVSSFYLGKKGLAYVSSIDVR